MLKKKVIGILLFAFVVTNLLSPFNVNAQEEAPEPLSLSLQMAQEKAVQNISSIAQINLQISNQLKRSNFTYTDGEFKVTDIENKINNLYHKVKNRYVLYSQEESKIYLFYAIFGDTDYFKGKEDIKKYIEPDRYPNYSLWSNVMKQSITIQNTEISIKSQTRLLYDKILSLKNKYSFTIESIKLQEKDLRQLKNKLAIGEESKVSVDIADKKLQTQQLELKMLSRTIDNLEIDLKNITSVPITSQIVLSEYKVNSNDKFEAYDTYLNSALANRSEIVSAKIDYWVAKNNLYGANNAFSANSLSPSAKINKGLAEARVTEAKLSISDSKELVMQNITDGYIDVKCKKEEAEIAKSNLDYANNQYKIATEKYNKQLISEMDKERERLNSLSAKITYNDAIRDYNYALYRLQQASKLGVAY